MQPNIKLNISLPLYLKIISIGHWLFWHKVWSQVQEPERTRSGLLLYLSLGLLSCSVIWFWVVMWNICCGSTFTGWDGFRLWSFTNFIHMLHTLFLVSNLVCLLLLLLLLSHISRFSSTLSQLYISYIFLLCCHHLVNAARAHLVFFSSAHFLCSSYVHSGGSLVSSWNTIAWEANFLARPLRTEFLQ